MPTIVKLKASTIGLSTTANTVDGANLVRLYNNSSSTSTVNQYDSSNNTIGSIDIANNAVVFLEKNPTDQINTTSGTISAVSIAFRA